jgi:hypothetical protein
MISWRYYYPVITPVHVITAIPSRTLESMPAIRRPGSSLGFSRSVTSRMLAMNSSSFELEPVERASTGKISPSWRCAERG